MQLSGMPLPSGPLPPLPKELQSQIFETVVANATFEQSLLLRLVSKSFSELVCRTLPRAESFYTAVKKRGGAPRGVVVEHMSTLVSTHPLQLPQPTPLGLYLHRIVEAVVSHEPLAGKWTLTTLAKHTISELLIRHNKALKALSFIHSAIFDLGSHFSGRYHTFEHDVVTLAVALDRPSVIAALLPSWNESGFKNGLFPSPIALAADSLSPERRAVFRDLLTREDALDNPLDNPETKSTKLCVLKGAARRYALAADNHYALEQIGDRCHFDKCCLNTAEPLHEVLDAVVKGNFQNTLAELVKSRPAKNQGVFFPISILEKAAWYGHVDIVVWAMEVKGANPNDKIASCYDLAIEVAAKRGYGDVVRVLLQHGAKIWGYVKEHPVIKAAAGGYVGVLQTMMEFEGQVGRPTKNQVLKALAVASKKGHSGYVDMLLTKYGKPDDTGEDVLRLLPDVLQAKHDGVVRLLLDKGVPQELRNMNR